MLTEKYDLVLVDFDGTICDLVVDWNSLKINVFNTFQNHFGWEKQLSLKSMINFILQTNNIEYKSTLFHLIQTYEFFNNEVVFKNVNHRLINQLQCFSIVSNNLNHTISFVLDKLHLLNKCNLIVGLDNVSSPKPSTNPFSILLSQLDINSHNLKIVMVGDSEIDKQFAKNSNIDFIHVKEV